MEASLGLHNNKKLAIVSIPTLLDDINMYSFHRRKYNFYYFLSKITLNFFFKNKCMYYYKLFHADLRKIEKKYRVIKRLPTIREIPVAHTIVIPEMNQLPEPSAPYLHDIIQNE